ncbi:enoyl-ACP reductase FabI [Oxalobacteraceae bacterium]|nr:enoyl-ACP reductase FabI [Oxalobacteraceae bacterium]
MNLPSPFSLAGKRGLILGLANEHSIAGGCARAAHALGAQLVLSCLNERSLPYAAPVAAALDAPLLCCDVEQAGALERLVRQAVAQLGGLDFVIHSIAWAPLAELQGRVADSSSAGFLRAMQVSCHSFAELARLCEPHLRVRGGALLTMSYLGADEAVPHYGIMGPVKAALESLVRYLAAELGPQGIRVHAISPGPVPTRAASGLSEFGALMQRACREAPLRRLVSLAEIGQLAGFLAGDAASGMTGQTIYVDGGYHVLG